jgi:hypothetical protein
MRKAFEPPLIAVLGTEWEGWQSILTEVLSDVCRYRHQLFVNLAPY